MLRIQLGDMFVERGSPLTVSNFQMPRQADWLGHRRGWSRRVEGWAR
jgi:hypothetical protein